MFSKYFKTSQKHIDKWAKIRLKGKTHFIIYRGVLGYGLFMFLFNTIYQHLRLTGFELSSLILIPMETIIVNLIIWSLAGVAFGYMLWFIMERNYNKSVDD
jgi:hypothetical protein